jgi:hypothetical protein
MKKTCFFSSMTEDNIQSIQNMEPNNLESHIFYQ